MDRLLVMPWVCGNILNTVILVALFLKNRVGN